MPAFAAAVVSGGVCALKKVVTFPQLGARSMKCRQDATFPHDLPGYCEGKLADNERTHGISLDLRVNTSLRCVP
ncbi:MAG: hypothetical protein OXD30_01535 [Bryobacterales bacterium]|nr:hypothetical protein [Bryobacterales bacterium]